MLDYQSVAQSSDFALSSFLASVVALAIDHECIVVSELH